MIISILDLFGATFGPTKTQAPLVVDPDAVLSRTISFERFESVARRYSQVIELCCRFQLPQSATGSGFNIGEAPNPLPGVQCCSLAAPEGLDQRCYNNAWRD